MEKRKGKKQGEENEEGRKAEDGGECEERKDKGEENDRGKIGNDTLVNWLPEQESGKMGGGEKGERPGKM